mmetsp:Transcript_29126/g.58183  ORF Transcript_29126/g.58183 Transcript_29126/m.58183 type:complete len:91 (-) Transcript_29126:16-288(-)
MLHELCSKSACTANVYGKVHRHGAFFFSLGSSSSSGSNPTSYALHQLLLRNTLHLSSPLANFLITTKRKASTARDPQVPILSPQQRIKSE